ncbi:hypothetical protein QBC35DRAFT_138675 [Podospora australis]|uniref:Uncharacterized protein n=1 Tax=Podospora australis TaxID=1536484 RepID=A0AAN7AL91_9PEZI|nr:hypothetical protein QBC35DRAFT_138675 [Podospora australis]
MMMDMGFSAVVLTVGADFQHHVIWPAITATKTMLLTHENFWVVGIMMTVNILPPSVFAGTPWLCLGQK